MRLAIFLSFALAVTYFSAAAITQEKGADARGEKYAALKENFEKEVTVLGKRFNDAEPEDKPKIRTEAKELHVLTASKAVRLATDNPKDAVGLDSALLAAKLLLVFRVTNEDTDKALAILAEHHLGNPKVQSLLSMASQAGDVGLKFLRTAADKSTDRAVKGVAMYLLGTTLAEQADETDDSTKAQDLTTEAIAYLEKAVKDAGDVHYGSEGTLAKTAEEDLVALRTLGIGKPAPDAEGTDLKTGHKVKLSSYKGKVVLLDVWATWCGPCKAMIPHERALAAKMKDKPFVLLSVSVDDEKKTLEEFLTKTEMPWTHWWDGADSELVKKYRVRAFPTLYLIDAKGVIRKKFVGAPEDKVLDKAIEELVSKANEK